MTWEWVVLILGIVLIIFVGLPLAMARYENSKKVSIFHRAPDGS